MDVSSEWTCGLGDCELSVLPYGEIYFPHVDGADESVCILRRHTDEVFVSQSEICATGRPGIRIEDELNAAICKRRHAVWS